MSIMKWFSRVTDNVLKFAFRAKALEGDAYQDSQ